ncbi:cytochrome P450 [Cladorrhinum sp. PSN332]|nr:cytochrome P450 [Cladorrhinum sp. PSN332]
MAYLASPGGLQTPLALLAATIAFGTLYLVASTLRQYYRLRHIPGPRSAGFSKWWWFKSERSGRMCMALLDVTEKYGWITRIAPNLLVTSDPDLMKRMLNVRTGYQRSTWYMGLQIEPGVNHVISTVDDAAHSKRRSKMAAGYSGKEVDGVEPRVDRNVGALIKLLDEKYITPGKPFDFARKAQFFTLDVISDISYDEAFGFLPSDSDMYHYIEESEEGLTTLLLLGLWPGLIRLLQHPLAKPLLPSFDDTVGFGKVKGIAKEKAAERFGPSKKIRNDMLGSFIKHGLTQEEAEPEIVIQIMAGSDTTATAIRATMLHVITNPRVVTALHAELDARGITSRDEDSIISDAEARSLPYLQAIIKEGLRIYPAVAGLMPKVVPPGGDTFKGVHLPEGTWIGYCAWGVMRRRDVWGDDAAEFRPERWLEAEPDKLKVMESTLELTFSYGRWQCLGKTIAYMELNKLFVELLRRFDFVLLDPANPWRTNHVGVHAQSDLWMKGYKRERTV